MSTAVRCCSSHCIPRSRVSAEPILRHCRGRSAAVNRSRETSSAKQASTVEAVIDAAENLVNLRSANRSVQ